MYIDSFTVSAILASLFVVAVLIYIIRSSNRRIEAKLRRYAAQPEYLREQSSCGDYCTVLRQMYTTAFPGIDFVVKDDGNSPHILRMAPRSDKTLGV